jgi:hypothetical protein
LLAAGVEAVAVLFQPLTPNRTFKRKPSKVERKSMDRLMPPRRGRVLEQPLPKISGVNDIGPAMAAITSQLNNGELTTEEASEMFGLLERYARAILAGGLAERVEKVEAQPKQMKSFQR